MQTLKARIPFSCKYLSIHALMLYSHGGNVLVTSMQTQTTQRPARLHAPSKRPPNHTTERRQQQPGSSQMNARPAMQHCHVPVHSPQPAPSGRHAAPRLPPYLGRAHAVELSTVQRPENNPRRGARQQTLPAGPSTGVTKHLHLLSSLPPLSNTSVTPVVCFTSKVFLLWACGATAACAGLRWHELTADRKAASLSPQQHLQGGLGAQLQTTCCHCSCLQHLSLMCDRIWRRNCWIPCTQDQAAARSRSYGHENPQQNTREHWRGGRLTWEPQEICRLLPHCRAWLQGAEEPAQSQGFWVCWSLLCSLANWLEASTSWLQAAFLPPAIPKAHTSKHSRSGGTNIPSSKDIRCGSCCSCFRLEELIQSRGPQHSLMLKQCMILSSRNTTSSRCPCKEASTWALSNS